MDNNSIQTTKSIMSKAHSVKFLHWSPVQNTCFISILAFGFATQTFADNLVNQSINKESIVNQTPQSAQQDIYGAVKPPKSTHELLLNLKYALDNNWPRNKDFFAETPLKNLFGGEGGKIKISRFNDRGDYANDTDETHMRAHWQHFNYLKSPSGLGFGVLGIRSFNGAFSLKHPQGGRISVFFEPGKIKFEEVEAIFGKGWKNSPVPPPSGKILHPTTSYYGNAEIYYRMNTQTLRREIYIACHSDGSIDDMYITVKEK